MSMYKVVKSKSSPGVAAVMSLILPGVGQVYTGRWLWALFFFIFTPGFWLGTGGLLGWVFHLWSAWHAYRSSEL